MHTDEQAGQVQTASFGREVEVPSLSEAQIEEISAIVFHAPKAKSSDVMLIFGAPEGDWSIAADAYKQGLAPLIVATGGVHERTNGKTEAALIKEELVAQGVPEHVILTEENASNSRDNVVFTKSLLEASGVHPKSLLFVTTHHHAGRCCLTLKKYFPDTELTAVTHGRLYSGLNITRDTWMHDPRAAARVYGEYQRILAYSQKGDIARPEVAS